MLALEGGGVVPFGVRSPLTNICSQPLLNQTALSVSPSDPGQALEPQFVPWASPGEANVGRCFPGARLKTAANFGQAPLSPDLPDG